MSIEFGMNWAWGFVLGAALGILIGSWIEAWVWRSSAGDFQTHKSGSKKYVVREYHL